MLIIFFSFYEHVGFDSKQESLACFACVFGEDGYHMWLETSCLCTTENSYLWLAYCFGTFHCTVWVFCGWFQSFLSPSINLNLKMLLLHLVSLGSQQARHVAEALPLHHDVLYCAAFAVDVSKVGDVTPVLLLLDTVGRVFVPVGGGMLTNAIYDTSDVIVCCLTLQ